MKACKDREPGRVAIIGLDDLNTLGLYILVSRGAISEVVLIGGGAAELADAFASLCEQAPLENKVRVWAGDFADASAADIAILAIGEPFDEETSGISVFRLNVIKIRDAARSLHKCGFDGVTLVTRAPVDLLARFVLEEMGCDPARVIGLGTGLDIKRFAAVLSMTEMADEAIIESLRDLPGHTTWCTATDHDVTFIDSCSDECPFFAEVIEKPSIHRQPSLSISQRKREIAVCVAQICDAVINDEKAVIPVYAFSGTGNSDEGEFIHSPCVIGRNGIEEMLNLPQNNGS